MTQLSKPHRKLAAQKDLQQTVLNALIASLERIDTNPPSLSNTALINAWNDGENNFTTLIDKIKFTNNDGIWHCALGKDFLLFPTHTATRAQIAKCYEIKPTLNGDSKVWRIFDCSIRLTLEPPVLIKGSISLI